MESSRGKAGHAQGEQSPVVCGGEIQIEQLILRINIHEIQGEGENLGSEESELSDTS